MLLLPPCPHRPQKALEDARDAYWQLHKRCRADFADLLHSCTAAAKAGRTGSGGNVHISSQLAGAWVLAPYLAPGAASVPGLAGGTRSCTASGWPWVIWDVLVPAAASLETEAAAGAQSGTQLHSHSSEVSPADTAGQQPGSSAASPSSPLSSLALLTGISLVQRWQQQAGLLARSLLQRATFAARLHAQVRSCLRYPAELAVFGSSLFAILDPDQPADVDVAICYDDLAALLLPAIGQGNEAHGLDQQHAVHSRPEVQLLQQVQQHLGQFYKGLQLVGQDSRVPLLRWPGSADALVPQFAFDLVADRGGVAKSLLVLGMLQKVGALWRLLCRLFCACLNVRQQVCCPRSVDVLSSL